MPEHVHVRTWLLYLNSASQGTCTLFGTSPSREPAVHACWPPGRAARDRAGHTSVLYLEFCVQVFSSFRELGTQSSADYAEAKQTHKYK